MLQEIVSRKTKNDLEILEKAGILKDFYLGGGTGLAFQLKHHLSLTFYALSTIKIEYEPVEEIKGDHTKTINTPGEGSDIFVEKNYGYIADGKKGLQIIDVSSIEDICIMGSCDTDGKASGIYVQNNFVYIADWDGGLKIIDTSIKENPYIIGSYCISGLSFTSISVEKYNVYVTYRKYDRDDSLIENGIQIIDTSSKEKPYLVAEFKRIPLDIT